MRSASLTLSALACLALAPSLARAQTIINTIPFVNTSFNTGPLTSVLGETFTTPYANILNGFAVQLGNTGSLTFSVFAYNPAANTTVGPALFTSAPTASTMVAGQSGYAFTTGNLVLTPGAIYAALLSNTASAYNGPAIAGFDAYTGGTVIGGGSLSGPFEDISVINHVPVDLAFTAAFTPEPGSFAFLAASALTGAAFLRRRRQAREAA